jgi:hypothetical protein
LFLDVTQRRAFLANSQGALTRTRRSACDARTKSLTATGKTGTRTIPLPPPAVELFALISKDKLPMRAAIHSRRGSTDCGSRHAVSTLCASITRHEPIPMASTRTPALKGSQQLASMIGTRVVTTAPASHEPRRRLWMCRTDRARSMRSCGGDHHYTPNRRAARLARHTDRRDLGFSSHR